MSAADDALLAAFGKDAIKPNAPISKADTAFASAFGSLAPGSNPQAPFVNGPLPIGNQGWFGVMQDTLANSDNIVGKYALIAKNAVAKGLSAIPDMVINAPQNAYNLGNIPFGLAATAAGRPDLAPDVSEPISPVTRLANKVGAIKPELTGATPGQRVFDTAVQGATGGLISPGSAIKNGLLGALSGGAGQATKEATGSDTAALVAALLAPVAGVGVVNASRAGGRVVDSVIDPLRQGEIGTTPSSSYGRQKLIANVLQSNSTDPAANAVKAANPEILVPGSDPTLGALTADPKMLSLEKTLRADNSAPFQARAALQNQARLNAVQDVAGSPGQIDYFKADRQTVANDLYKQAFEQNPTPTPWIQGQFTQLMKRPAFVSALKDAQEQAANEGVQLNPDNQTQIAHYAKMALDSQIEQATRSGASTKGLIDTRNTLVSLMESKDFSPAYKDARATYAAMSKPINQMEAGQQILDKGQAPAADILSNPVLSLAKFKNQINDPNISKNLSPEQAQMMSNVLSDMNRSNLPLTAMKQTGGSDTAALTEAGRNLVKEYLGNKIFGFAYSPQAKRVESGVTAAMLNPKEAAPYLSANLSPQPYMKIQNPNAQTLYLIAQALKGQ